MSGIKALELRASFFTSDDAWRLWEWVDISGGDKACWLWRGSVSPRGYGILRLHRSGKRFTLLAHRVALALTIGAVPDGMLVCHRCDNPGCINPAHLWLGTQAQNIDDKVLKRRQAWGSSHGMVKLTENQIAEIRAETGKHRDIAICFGVHQTTISRIKRRASWRS